MCGQYALVNGKMIFQLFGNRRLGNRKDAHDDLPEV